MKGLILEAFNKISGKEKIDTKTPEIKLEKEPEDWNHNDVLFLAALEQAEEVEVKYVTLYNRLGNLKGNMKQLLRPEPLCINDTITLVEHLRNREKQILQLSSEIKTKQEDNARKVSDGTYIRALQESYTILNRVRQIKI